MIHVKNLEKQDIPKVLDLYRDFINDQYGQNKYFDSKMFNINCSKRADYYNKVIDSDKNKIFVATEKDDVIAIATASILGPGGFFEFDDHGYIFDFFVKKEYRTFLLSMHLFKACEQWIKEQGCKYITVYTYAFNKRTQRLLEFEKMEPYKIVYIKNFE